MLDQAMRRGGVWLPGGGSCWARHSESLELVIVRRRYTVHARHHMCRNSRREAAVITGPKLRLWRWEDVAAGPWGWKRAGGQTQIRGVILHKLGPRHHQKLQDTEDKGSGCIPALSIAQPNKGSVCLDLLLTLCMNSHQPRKQDAPSVTRQGKKVRSIQLWVYDHPQILFGPRAI